MTLTDTDHTAQLPRLKHLFTMQARLGASYESVGTPLGRRVVNTVASGAFSGARMHGSMEAGGDWMLTRGDGVSVIDARVVLKTDDGAIIHMSYSGRIVVPAELIPAVRDPATRATVDPERYYIRSAPFFETGAPAYAWLNSIVCISKARLTSEGVTYEVFEVL